MHLPCLLQQPFQQCAADALAAPVGQHRHASDVPIGQQAPGADGRAVAISCDHVPASRIMLVELDLARHLLLRDEHRFAYLARRRFKLGPVAGLDTELDDIHRHKNRHQVE